MLRRASKARNLDLPVLFMRRGRWRVAYNPLRCSVDLVRAAVRTAAKMNNQIRSTGGLV